MIAALYVQPDGCYAGLPDVDAWGEERDARLYAGPHPVVAHPPCQRWGRFWHGSTRKPHQFKLGDDGGCFAAALASVRRWGGILEHPADSQAWAHFGLTPPPRTGGWHAADFDGGWTCYVEQGFYGHLSRKGTWLYAHSVDLPTLRWGEGEQRLHPIALERYGYAKARRIGMMAMVGGKRKTEIRNATPPEFRDLLLSITRTVRNSSMPTEITKLKQVGDHEDARIFPQPSHTTDLTLWPSVCDDPFVTDLCDLSARYVVGNHNTLEMVRALLSTASGLLAMDHGDRATAIRERIRELRQDV